MNKKSLAIRLIYPALFFGLFAVLPLAIAREDKCTNGQTAYMIAKRYTSEQTALSTDDNPDFPWHDPAMVSYRGRCSHEVHSWFDRTRNKVRERTEYVARVHYDVIMNHWSLESWQETGRHETGKSPTG
jgi:hypothetical protein